MARVEVHKEVPKELKHGDWNLCFQKVTYHYDDGEVHKMAFASFGDGPMVRYKHRVVRLA